MFISSVSQYITFFLGVTLMAVLPELAQAGVMENIIAPTVGLKNLMIMLSYMFGIGFLLAGLMQYNRYRQNPSETRLSSPVALVILGIALLLLPIATRPASGSKVKETDIGKNYQFIGE